MYLRMHCYAFEIYLKDGPLRRSSECIAMHSKCISKTVPKKEFRMHCYVFEMYLKDGPLRRSSECIDLHNAVPKRRSLKEF